MKIPESTPESPGDGSPRARQGAVNAEPAQQVNSDGKPATSARPANAQQALGAASGQAKEQRMIQAQTGERDKAVKILAKTIFRELTMNGYETRQIVALSTELIGLVTSAMNGKAETGDAG